MAPEIRLALERKTHVNLHDVTGVVERVNTLQRGSMTNEQNIEQQIQTISRWIIESARCVAFTGAGISTDSGIPDFRGPEGVWTRRDAGLPAPEWRVPRNQVQPNASHLALRELQRLGKLDFLITQNTDNLHRTFGIDPERLAELHGNGWLMRCLQCEELVGRREVGWDRKRWGKGRRNHRPVAGQPDCPACGGRLISSVVAFGDPLPRHDLARARRHARECDLMLVLGSSLVVEPAASLVGEALDAGARMVLVNRGDTPYDEKVTLRSRAGIADVIPPAVCLVKQALEAQARS
jgi:NAD-dependent deacetylase